MTARERIAAAFSTRYGKDVRVRYVRSCRGAIEGRGWYIQPFGESERRISGTAAQILSEMEVMS